MYLAQNLRRMPQCLLHGMLAVYVDLILSHVSKLCTFLPFLSILPEYKQVTNKIFSFGGGHCIWA